MAETATGRPVWQLRSLYIGIDALKHSTAVSQRLTYRHFIGPLHLNTGEELPHTQVGLKIKYWCPQPGISCFPLCWAAGLPCQ